MLSDAGYEQVHVHVQMGVQVQVLVRAIGDAESLAFQVLVHVQVQVRVQVQVHVQMQVHVCAGALDVVVTGLCAYRLGLGVLARALARDVLFFFSHNLSTMRII